MNAAAHLLLHGVQPCVGFPSGRGSEEAQKEAMDPLLTERTLQDSVLTQEAAQSPGSRESLDPCPREEERPWAWPG